MSGGQDDANNAIDSSSGSVELRRLLKECEGNEVLASQLRQRIEDAEDVMEPDLPSFNELLNMPSEPCPWFEEKENDVSNTIWCPHCLETLDSTEGDNWCCERCGMILSDRCEPKKENDMNEELDLSKPCEARPSGSDKWECVIGVPVFAGKTKEPRYGCYLKYDEESLVHVWLTRAQIRNVREPAYEPHTQETLLPLANEWVHYCDDKNTVVRIEKLTTDEVSIEGNMWRYETIAVRWYWATGPHKGKPVAREVV